MNKHFYSRVAVCCLLTLIPLFTLTSVLYYSYLYHSERWTQYSAQKAVFAIESIFDFGEMANQLALKNIGSPCKVVVKNLRHEVTSIPYVRSVNLAKNNIIYCTSLFGKSNFEDDDSEYINNKLLLMPGNNVKKDHPLIVIRTTNGQTSALSGIDGLYIQALLSQQEDESLMLFLKIENEWLSENGSFFFDSPKTPLFFGNNIESKKYPFSVYAGLNYESKWLGFLNSNRNILIYLMIVLISFSIIMWWQLNKPRDFIHELKRALDHNEFIPYAQPIVDSSSKKIIGIEILMRWQHPINGIVRPDLFIPQAEDSGLIVPMTTSMFKNTAKSIKKYESILPNNFHIGINITATHCIGMRLFYDCQEFLAHINSSKIKLVLELTERQKLDVTPSTLSLFNKINMIGVNLAIDDFGTGHSSLNYLNHLNVKILKIDLSFVSQVGSNSLSEHLIDNIIDLGERLGISMIAEGVETDYQANYLEKKGVEYLQGYLIGKPIPLENLLSSLEE
ncbi:EAL domain-containing protein [Aeromonas jandaei]|uniref:EAL domain-containing protein n=1 Tax=Aeromonas jandaei TaxID=650 RepID=UPI00191EDCB7|nr:cyclic diguanylate phosphodiesterase [Aeromonas jandaei]MBL0667041.1 EAL domain-containing protein [Aeromonas jandaei]